MSAFGLVPITEPSELSYGLLLQETQAVLSAAQSFNFPGLRKDFARTPPAQTATLTTDAPRRVGNLLIHSHPVLQPPIVRRTLIETVEHQVKLLRAEERCPTWSGGALQFSATYRNVGIRDLKRVIETVKDAKKQLMRALTWPERFRLATWNRLKDVLDRSSESKCSIPKLVARLRDEAKPQYIPRETKGQLFDHAENLRRYWIHKLRTRGDELAKPAQSSAEEVLVDWKTMLWLEATAQLWVADAKAAIVDAELCDAYGKQKCADLVCEIAFEVGLGTPDFAPDAASEEEDLSRLIASARRDVDSARSVAMANARLELIGRAIKENPRSANELYYRLASMIGRLIDAAAEEAIDSGCTADHYTLQCTVARLRSRFEDDFKHKKISNVDDDDNHLAIINQLGEVMIELMASSFQYKLVVERHERTGRRAHRQESLATEQAHSVVAVISARTARRYNI